jgi:hypothetical protein
MYTSAPGGSDWIVTMRWTQPATNRKGMVGRRM